MNPSGLTIAQREDFLAPIAFGGIWRWRKLAPQGRDGLGFFVETYRPYLRSEPAAILRASASSAEARELAIRFCGALRTGRPGKRESDRFSYFTDEVR